MKEIFSKIVSAIVKFSSNTKNKNNKRRLVLLLASSLIFNSCENYEKQFALSHDKETNFTELLSDYKRIQKENLNMDFLDADYTKEIELWEKISVNLIQFIKKDPRSDRTVYILDIPWHLGLVVNNNLKENNINTTFDVDIDYAEDKKVNDVDYSKFFWIMDKIGGPSINDEHIAEKRDWVITTKPYVLLFDYNRVKDGLNDLENEKTFHNQYTIEEKLPWKEMFKWEDAMREKVIVFTLKEMNQDLSGWLMELAKIDDVPVQVVIIDEKWDLVDVEIPEDLKTTWQENKPNETRTIRSNWWVPFWYRYYLWTHSRQYNNSNHIHYYGGGARKLSFKSNGVTTKTTSNHFQKSNPMRTSTKFHGWSSIRWS